MSLDISLRAPVCQHCKAEPKEYFTANITHNLTAMWVRADCYGALYESHGKKAGTIVAKLSSAIAYMEEHEDAYRRLNPGNGWGSYEGALSFLRRLRDACQHWQEAVIHVCS